MRYSQYVEQMNELTKEKEEFQFISIPFLNINVPSQQLQRQLQTQHSADFELLL
jgi:hypothetical protein